MFPKFFSFKKTYARNMPKSFIRQMNVKYVFLISRYKNDAWSDGPFEHRQKMGSTRKKVCDKKRRKGKQLGKKLKHEMKRKLETGGRPRQEDRLGMERTVGVATVLRHNCIKHGTLASSAGGTSRHGDSCRPGTTGATLE